MPSPSDSPGALARFPREVREAFARVQSDQAPAALRLIIEAALRDYLPSASPFSKSAPILDEHRLIEDLGFDSLAIAETVFFFEDIFQVRIDNQDILALHTVGELHAYVARRLREQNKTA